ncbi:unnamed protein product [Dracunculus medinensis]|uniref:tRNA (uracil-O(2)-)-methyltransferase n=1 Tax=Dracunculus medinensis TaxID=318479 RepID=A0A0N4UEE5_DRAME|nr:unnamed protein product [Dracunculus medinensis]
MDNHRSNIANLNLIDLDNYAQTYRMIKENFGHQIAANWKEKTDPRKFVYEDCAIAAYLLETWRRKKRFPQNFCDIGCGNGLLVYLLYKLQVKGYGVDIRKRNIWLDFKGADLRELALNPELETNSDCNEFRRVDYLIGNHCDELTPWIPVIAARLRCDFFLLPCCPYDFYSRYRKKSKSSAGYSSYWSYLDYIKSICMRLGYKVEEDGLKIPSTKRYCFVCSVPNEKLPEDIDARISEILLTSKSGNFIPREKISQETYDFREWRRGKTCNILEIANLLDSNEKNQLKNSNGGVKTFLKNQHQIFYVINFNLYSRVAGNEVSIRNWPVEGQRHVEGKLKTRKCWFKENHPDGCPLSDTDCSYSHIF